MEQHYQHHLPGAEGSKGTDTGKGYKVISKRANGGKGAMTDPNSPYSKNDSVLVSKCGFTYQGKTFVSWNTKADGSGTTYVPGDKFYIKGDVTLYAIWKKILRWNSVKPGR